MTKGYWIVDVNVTDPEGYKTYAKAAQEVIHRHGGRYLIRGGSAETMEGVAPGSRHVVIEFASLDSARKCYLSDAYQKAMKIRQANSTGRLTIVEGSG